MNLGVGLAQSIEQRASPGPLAGLESHNLVPLGRVLFVELHQQIQVELVVALRRGKVGGTQFLASDLGAEGLTNLQRSLNLSTGLDQVPQEAVNEGNLGERHSFPLAIPHGSAER